MTTEQLIDTLIGVERFEDIDVWFPETKSSDVNGWTFPLTEHEQLMKCPSLVGKTFVTVGETFILFMLRAIRKKQIANLELWCGDRQIDVSIDGDMIDYWDGGFFESGFNLRFR
jgi:hypothetical protein